MAKHPRKRQKLDNDDKPDNKNKRREKAQRVPLGTPLVVDNEAEKDDEERRLESMLFGTKFVPMDVPGTELMASDDEGGALGEGEEEGTGQLQHLLDSDVRVFPSWFIAGDQTLHKIYSYFLWTTVLQRRYMISNQILKRAAKKKIMQNQNPYRQNLSKN